MSPAWRSCPTLRGQGGFLLITEVSFLIADDLVILMPLTGNHDEIFPRGEADGFAYGLPSVDLLEVDSSHGQISS